MHIKTITVVLAGILLSDAAIAASPLEGRAGEALEKRFHQLDTNRDGALSREEAKGNRWLSRRFDGLDTNGDGKLTMEEMKMRLRERAHGKPQASVPDQAADNARIVRPVMNYCAHVGRAAFRPSVTEQKATDSSPPEAGCPRRAAAGVSAARILV